MRYLIIIILVIFIVAIFFIIKSISLPTKIRKAEEFLGDGLVSKANEIIKKILDNKKEYVPARYIRALILIKQNQYLLAISELNGILNIPGFNKFIKELDLHYHLAKLYNETKNFQKEIEEYKMILVFNPDNLTANHRIGHALYKLKDYRKAKDHLTKAIIIDPTLKDVYLPLGISCFNVSNYEKGEEYLTLAMKNRGEHSDAQFYLGSIYKMKKDFDNAIEMFESAQNNKKYYINCLYLIGEIYFEQCQYDNAIETLERGLNNLKERTEETFSYRYLLAECYELGNKINEAVHHWSKISEVNPNFRSTKIKLESYREILDNKNLMSIFTSSLEEIQPIIDELISSINYNIISKEKITSNEYQYKAYNIKRTNDPPVLIYFNRTTREVTEGDIIEFQKKVSNEKSKGGIYITTSKFSIRAKTNAQSKMIEIYDSDYVNKVVEKIQSRREHVK